MDLFTKRFLRKYLIVLAPVGEGGCLAVQCLYVLDIVLDVLDVGVGDYLYNLGEQGLSLYPYLFVLLECAGFT